MKYKNNKWKKIKICELGKIITGKTPKTSIKDNYNGNILFLTPSDNMNLKKVSKTKRTLTKKGVNSVKNCLLPPNSICVSCIGSDLGKVIITTKNTVTNQQINSIIPNQNYDNNYIYYMMCILGKKLNYLSKTSTAVPIINKRNFSSYEIYVPELIQQRKIAKILNCIDDKIDLNNKINKNLQSISKLLFKHWFVDFEFPNEEGKPYKSSGGEMIDSELGEIPKGWEVKTLKNIAKNIITGKTPSTKINENYGNKYPFITIPDMHNNMYIIKTERYLSEIGHITQQKKLIPSNSIIVSCIATIGLVSITTEASHTNQQINSIILKNENELFYYYEALKNIKYKLMGIGSTGSTTLNVNKSEFEKLKFICPHNLILDKYGKILKPLFQKIKENIRENQFLESLRDTLLPKLMNGEIDVSNIDLNE